MTAFSESVVTQAALAWLERRGWRVTHGLDIAPGEAGAERADYAQVVLEGRLRDALARLNPALPPEALEDAFRRLTRPEGAEVSARNRAVHRLLMEGVRVDYRAADSEIRGAQARALDFDEPTNNDWLAVNPFTASESKHTLWHRLLGRPASEYGRLCHGGGAHGRGARCRWVLMLPTLSS